MSRIAVQIIPLQEEIKIIREKKEREQTFSDPGSASDSSDSETVSFTNSWIVTVTTT